MVVGSLKTLELAYESREALVADVATNLKKARAFVRGQHDVDERELCELVLVHPEHGGSFQLQAEAVWVGPDGVGLEIHGLNEARKLALEAFVASEGDSAAVDQGEIELEASARRSARNLYERIRASSLREREETARRGSLPERVALERAFGGAVWEGLLQNPQLTPPEVARIAKNGTLTKPLVAVIVANAGWMTNPEVQRALLGNPRCTGPALEKVLRSLKPAEVVRLAQHCPYRQEVRAIAQRLTQKR